MMKYREQVISLYDEALLYRTDPEDTLCHLSGIDDAEAYGSYLALLISRLGISSTICDIGCGTLSPLRVLKNVFMPPDIVLRCRRPVKTNKEADLKDQNVEKNLEENANFSYPFSPCSCNTPLGYFGTQDCFKGQSPVEQRIQGDIIKELRYTALDINDIMIKKAKERWKDYPNISFGIYDLEDCNLQNNYDIILLQESLAYFEEEDINNLIDYYYTKTNKVLSLSLLDGTLPWQVQDELLISQRHPMTTLSYVLANYQFSTVDRALHPNRYRVSIFKEQKYYDLVQGIERGHYFWQR